MATETAPGGSDGACQAAVDRPDGQFVEYDRYIDGRLRTTRRHVKGVDLAGGLMTLGIGSLIYLVVVVLADHWLVSGGLGFWWRLACLAGFALGVLAYSARRLLPLVVRRVNPVYAAHAIERSRPSLKNSLINFLLLRSSPTSLAPAVYDAVEEQAARSLSAVPIETAVDRSGLIRLGWILLAVVTVASLYKVVSPKDPLRSVGRLLAPWADIAAPTRVTIDEVQPGNVEAFHDQQVTVSALVSGVAADEPVTLRFSTADGQAVDQAVLMALPDGSYRYAVDFPPGGAGLQQDVTYEIAAGDAVSRHYRIHVVAAPSIQVDSIEYDYPKYTEIAGRRLERQGDIQALEGTRVTIQSTANDEIQSAYLDFDCDGRSDLAMLPEGRQARVAFTLALQAGSDKPEHESYQLRFTNHEGHENPQPIRYKIAVTRDLAPEVALVEPQIDSKEEIQLPLGEALRLVFEAADADFKLAQLTLQSQRGDEPLFDESLLAEPRSGKFRRDFLLDSDHYGLEGGDLVVFWAAAEDNKQPQPNRTETPRYTVRIVSPQGADKPPDQLAQADQNKQQPPPDKPPQGNPDQNQPMPGEAGQQPDAQRSEPQPGDNEGGQKQRADGEQKGASEGSKPSGDAADGDQTGAGGSNGGKKEPDERVDPVSNPGEAFEKILNRREEAHKEQNKSPRAAPTPKPADTPPRDQAAEPREAQVPGEAQPQSDGQPGKDERPAPAVGASPDSQRAGREPGDANPAGPRDDQATGAKPEPGQQKPEPGQQKPEPGQKEPGPGQQGGNQKPSGREGTKPAGDAAQPGDRPPGDGAKPQPAGETPDADTQQGAKPRPDDTSPKGQGRAVGDQPAPAHRGGKQPKPGDGGQAPPAAKPEDHRNNAQQQESAQKGGDPEGTDKGEGGAGQPGGDEQGAPAPQSANQARDKKGQSADGGQPQPQDQPKSPSGSRKQSDSAEGEAGDQSGGGSEGGGQKSPSPGTGSAGQNTAADEGGGQADQKGEGVTGTSGGDKTPAAGPVDDARSQGEGPGSKKRPGSSKTGSGHDPPDAAKPAKDGEPPGNSPSPPTQGRQGPIANQSQHASPEKTGQQPTQQPGAERGAASGNPTAGGVPGQDDAGPIEPSDAPEPGGDEANLEYSRKATDLALGYLKDQLAREKPDPKLLDRLKWTRDDIEAFVRRWEEMKRAAKEPGPKGQEAREQLDDTLRSLGLRPRGTSLAGGRTPEDRRRRLREAPRTSPPSEYADQYREYTKGTAKGRQ